MAKIDGIRRLRLLARPQALTDDCRNKIREICNLNDINAKEIHINGINIDGYISYAEMAEILEQLEI